MYSGIPSASKNAIASVSFAARSSPWALIDVARLAPMPSMPFAVHIAQCTDELRLQRSTIVSGFCLLERVAITLRRQLISLIMRLTVRKLAASPVCWNYLPAHALVDDAAVRRRVEQHSFKGAAISSAQAATWPRRWAPWITK